jgi:hypothetical protein
MILHFSSFPSGLHHLPPPNHLVWCCFFEDVSSRIYDCSSHSIGTEQERLTQQSESQSTNCSHCQFPALPGCLDQTLIYDCLLPMIMDSNKRKRRGQRNTMNVFTGIAVLPLLSLYCLLLFGQCPSANGLISSISSFSKHNSIVVKRNDESCLKLMSRTVSTQERHPIKVFLQQQESSNSDIESMDEIKDYSTNINEATITTTSESTPPVGVGVMNDHSHQKEERIATTKTTITTPQFGDVVPMKRPSSSSSSSTTKIDDTISASSLFFSNSSPTSAAVEEGHENGTSSPNTPTMNGSRNNKPVTSTTTTSTTTTTPNNTSNIGQDQSQLLRRKQRNIAVAVASISLAVLNYAWQWTHPITPIQLLVNMQQSSSPLDNIGTNHKPTVIDFWAPW